MLDALVPANALADGGSLSDALAGARSGAEATETMAPRRGRSSYLGDRVHGHRDAGTPGRRALWCGWRPCQR